MGYIQVEKQAAGDVSRVLVRYVFVPVDREVDDKDNKEDKDDLENSHANVLHNIHLANVRWARHVKSALLDLLILLQVDELVIALVFGVARVELNL